MTRGPFSSSEDEPARVISGPFSSSEDPPAGKKSRPFGRFKEDPPARVIPGPFGRFKEEDPPAEKTPELFGSSTGKYEPARVMPGPFGRFREDPPPMPKSYPATLRRSNSYHSETKADLHQDIDRVTAFARDVLQLGPQMDWLDALLEHDHEAHTEHKKNPERSPGAEFYLAAIRKYVSEGYRTINLYTENRKKPSNWDLSDYFYADDVLRRTRTETNTINKIFRGIPPTTEEIVVYRGVRGDTPVDEALRAGAQIVYPLNKFTSTSIEFSSTFNFTQNKQGKKTGNEKGNIIRIIIPVNSKIIPLFDWIRFAPDVADYPTEYEILLHYDGKLTKIRSPEEDPTYHVTTYLYEGPSEYFVYNTAELAISRYN